MKVILFIILLTSAQLTYSRQKLSFLDDSTGCWLKAKGRGIGKPIHKCAKDLEQSGLLCYPHCDAGFTGVGPVCWQNCPDRFRDDGAFCFKPSSYGRGVGYTRIDKCKQENPSGCERWGLLFYPICSNGFHNVACCVCSPNCPEGMSDIGISCAKKTHGRGVGVPLACAENEDYDAALCYKPCKDEFKGIGPVCWGSCPAGYTQCGALCLKDEACDQKIKQYMQGVIDIITAFAAEHYIEGIIDIGKFAKDFVYPICK